MGVICAGCGETNREGARFCRSCGEAVTPRCGACGAEIPGDSRFCDACGAPVESTESGSPARTAEARKVVSVLFADLAGSTRLQERMDAESVRRVMDGFYDVMHEAVTAHGGTVVKFMGDGLMAAFGVPSVAEDDAVRAVRAAAAMQAAFVAVAERVRRDWEADVALRVGINTGEVVVAEGEDDVVGDAVNVAARLEHAAGDGHVLVGQETWRLTRHVFTFAEPDLLELKGKAQPVPGYRLVSVEPAVEEATSPFVGRERELGRLTAAFEAAVAQRRAHLVTVVGSPGLGKSRLVREAARRFADRALVVETQCDPAGGSTLASVAEVLRKAVGVDESAAPDEAISALQAVFGEGNDDAARVTAAAATVLGAGGASSPQETFWAVRRILEQVSATRPTVVVFDDVHWAEPLLLDLVEHVAEWTRDSPLLLVAAARPEIREVRPALAETGGPSVDVVVLGALDDEEGVRLASEFLDGHPLDDAVAARLLASAEGNPLFLREVVKMLVEDGALHLDGDVWIAADGFDVAVPPTIHALLSARIERLAVDERTVVEGASVVGHQFFRGAVAALAPAPVASRVDAHLESLRRKEVVEPEGTYWIDEPVFRFHHGLIRDAAYRRLLKEARAELHERVADWLAAKAGDVVADHQEVIGYHLEQAFTYRRDLGSANGTAGDLGRRAAVHLAAAGRRSLERDDLRSATGLLARALDCLPADDPSRAELLVDRCEALLGLGEVTAGAEAVAELQRATSGDARLMAWADAFAAQAASFSHPEALPEWVDRAAASADRLEELGDPVGAAKAASVHASILARLGQVAACEAALDRALAAARDAGDRRRANAVLAGAPLAALWGPSPVTRAAGRCLDVVRVLRITTDSPPVEAVALRAQAVLESFRGRFDAARRLIGTSRRTLEDLGFRHGLLQTDLFAGVIELAADDPQAAEALLRRAYEGFRDLGAGVDAAQAAALLARTCLAQGRDEEAVRLAEESEQLGGQDLKTAIAWRAVRAEATARRGEAEEAIRLARQAVELAAPTDALVDHADARLALANVMRLSGDEAGAADEARRAAELYEAKGATALAERVEPARRASRVLEGAGSVEARHPSVSVLDDAARSVPALEQPQEDGGSEGLVRVSSTTHPHAPTLALRTYLRGKAATEAGDIDGILAVAADDFFVEERTRSSGLFTPLRGKDALRDYYALVFTGQVSFPEWEVVATRGERLLLTRALLSWTDAAGTTTEHLHLRLDEVDDSGRIVAAILFEPDAVLDAVFELDHRYGASEPSMVPLLELSEATTRAYSEGDWDGYEALLAPGFVAVDHRFTGWGEVDAAAFVARLRALKDLVPDTVLWLAAIERSEGNVSLARFMARGTTVDGGRVEFPWCSVTVRSGGRVQRFELFDIEDRADAEARFEALARESAPDQRSNLATAAWARVRHGLMTLDVEATLAPLREDAVQEERKHAPARVTIEGRAAMVPMMEQVFAQPGGHDRIETTVVAIRGERLALTDNTFHWVDEAGDVSEYRQLRVDETDDEGRITAIVVFEPEHFDDALDELDARYRASLPPALHSSFDQIVAGRRAYNAHDWDGVRSLLTDDFVLVDHRLGWFGTVDRDGYVERMSGLQSVAAEIRIVVADIPRLAPGGSLVRWRTTGTGLEGGDVEIVLDSVATARGGLTDRFEFYPVEDRDAALARFEELVHSTELSTPAPTNGAAEAWRRFQSGAGAGEVEGGTKLLSVGAVAADLEPIAVCGEDLFLGRLVRTPGEPHEGAQVGDFVVAMVHPDGELVRSAAFGAGDFDAAYRTLHEWYAESLDPAHRQYLELYQRVDEVYRARDIEGYRRLLTDDFVLVDNRPAGWGRLGADEYCAHLGGLFALADDITTYQAEMRISAKGGFGRTVARVSGIEGGTAEITFPAVALPTGDRFSYMEFFAEEDRDRALARFRELTSEPDEAAP